MTQVIPCQESTNPSWGLLTENPEIRISRDFTGLKYSPSATGNVFVQDRGGFLPK